MWGSDCELPAKEEIMYNMLALNMGSIFLRIRRGTVRACTWILYIGFKRDGILFWTRKKPEDACQATNSVVKVRSAG